jgi:hypothetical protein
MRGGAPTVGAVEKAIGGGVVAREVAGSLLDRLSHGEARSRAWSSGGPMLK